MQSQTWQARCIQASVAAVVLMTGAWVHADDQQSDPVGQIQSVIEQALQSDAAGEIRRYLEDSVSRVQNPSSHWLGVTCRPASAALRSQLKLAADRGLVVIAVAPESPAAEAGVELHDVLIEAGSTVLTDVPVLVDAIEEAVEEEDTLHIELLRAGEPVSVEVEPAERPADLTERLMEQGNELLQLSQDGANSLLLDLPRPGVIMEELAGRLELPENMSITVTREGSQPATVTVTRDDETWELTEEDLGELPNEVRALVQRSLGQLPNVRLPEGFPTLERLRNAEPGEVVPPLVGRLEEQVNRAVERAEQMLERRLERLTDRLEKLEQKLEVEEEVEIEVEVDESNDL